MNDLDKIIPDDVIIGGGPPEIVISYEQAWSQGEAACRRWMHEAQRRGLTIWDEPENMQYRITTYGPGDDAAGPFPHG